MTFKAAKCPNCGGDLQVPDDRTSIKCMYCGGEVMVHTAIQAAAGGNVANWMNLGKSAMDAGNSEEAISYFNKVLEVESHNHEAWMAKGEAAGWLSTLANCRLPEMLSCERQAVERAPEGAKQEVKTKVADAINRVVSAYFTLADGHVREFVSVRDTWPDHLGRCAQAVAALEEAHAYAPTNKSVIENIIHICKNNLEGIAYADADAYGNETGSVASVSDQYAASLQAKMTEYVQKMQRLDSSFQQPQVQKAQASGSGCFVATATLGIADHPDVQLLRQFRDAYLSKSVVGKGFTRCYYAYGPVFAKAIRNSRWLRVISYIALVRPSALVAGWFLSRGFRQR